MALIKCSECNNELSNKAKLCPHCGCPIEEILINKISNQRLKDLLKKKRIINKVNQNKKDFLLQNNLCDEIYVPIVINAEGYSSDDIKKENVIKFKKMASEDKLHVGDIVNVKRGDGQTVAVTISKITYSEDSFDKTTFPNAKYSTEFNLQRHYKKNPIELSDDDYEIASEYSNHINNSNHNLVNSNETNSQQPTIFDLLYSINNKLAFFVIITVIGIVGTIIVLLNSL